jgi:peptidylprolyl isomerase
LKKVLLSGLCIILLTAVIFSGCAKHKDARDGDIVRLHYTVKLADGTIADSTIGSDPMEVTLGTGDVIAGFEKAVLGMKVGESKTFTVLAADAYGAHRDDLVIEVNRDRLAEGVDPDVGEYLQTTLADGSVAQMLVVAVSDTTVTIDANAPLAGKDLTFEVTLVAIK